MTKQKARPKGGRKGGDLDADSRFVKLILRAHREHGGCDVCHGCGRPLRHGDVTLIGWGRGGGLVVAGCCRGELRALLGFGIYHTWLGVARPWGAA
jgi:hypothetical protein